MSTTIKLLWQFHSRTLWIMQLLVTKNAFYWIINCGRCCCCYHWGELMCLISIKSQSKTHKIRSSRLPSGCESSSSEQSYNLTFFIIVTKLQKILRWNLENIKSLELCTFHEYQLDDTSFEKCERRTCKFDFIHKMRVWLSIKLKHFQVCHKRIFTLVRLRCHNEFQSNTWVAEYKFFQNPHDRQSFLFPCLKIQ